MFLANCLKKVGQKLATIVRAVAAASPPPFSGGGMWEAMHGDMGGYFEARTVGPDKRLYRLFCLLEPARHGLERLSIVVLGGMSKPKGTAFTAAEYAGIRALGDAYRRRSPRNIERFA